LLKKPKSQQTWRKMCASSLGDLGMKKDLRNYLSDPRKGELALENRLAYVDNNFVLQSTKQLD